MAEIDLNCDMGEGFGAYALGDDEAMLDIVSSANVACGFHAGDPVTMTKVMALAARKGVSIGAHPSQFDIWGFGRRQIVGELPEDITKHVIYQVGAAAAIARSVGARLAHLKAHGFLANLAQEDPVIAEALVDAIRRADRDLYVLVMPGMATEAAARRTGAGFVREIYADRAYADTGNLLSRRLPGAMIADPERVAERVIQMLQEGAIVCASGKRIPARIESVCVHGDTADAVALAGTLRRRLEDAGYHIAPPRPNTSEEAQT